MDFWRGHFDPFDESIVVERAVPAEGRYGIENSALFFDGVDDIVQLTVNNGLPEGMKLGPPAFGSNWKTSPEARER